MSVHTSTDATGRCPRERPVYIGLFIKEKAAEQDAERLAALYDRETRVVEEAE